MCKKDEKKNQYIPEKFRKFSRNLEQILEKFRNFDENFQKERNLEIFLDICI